MEASRIEETELSKELCQRLLTHFREQGNHFRFIDKEEEPPIRTLDHGIFGEGVEAEVPPYPYMVKGRSGRWYHGYRCDMNICDELCHATPELRQIFGPEDSENAASFRLVMGYAVGSNTDLCGTSPELLEQLSQVLGPASTKVYSDTTVSRIYSVYAIAMLPGQTVPLHLDVPEFHGIERSSCPNWLLVAAHCSGIFSPLRVRNVTSVCYPATRHAGALAVYHPDQGGVHNVTGGTALLLDTDSHFHHSQVAGGSEIPVPHLPEGSTLEVEEEEGGKVVWKVVKDGQLVRKYDEEEIRFTLSAKFHLFRSEEEAAQFYAGKGGRLTAEAILDGLISSLESQDKLPVGLSRKSPLHQLAPVIIREFILPRAPTPIQMEEHWNSKSRNR